MSPRQTSMAMMGISQRLSRWTSCQISPPPLHVRRMMVHHRHHQGEEIGKVLVRVPRQGQEGGGIEDTLMNHRSGYHGQLRGLFYSIFLQSQVSMGHQSRRPPRLSENISFSWGGGYPLHFFFAPFHVKLREHNKSLNNLLCLLYCIRLYWVSMFLKLFPSLFKNPCSSQKLI
jgi:hypothetical protein